MLRLIVLPVQRNKEDCPPDRLITPSHGFLYGHKSSTNHLQIVCSVLCWRLLILESRLIKADQDIDVRYIGVRYIGVQDRQQLV